MLSLFTESHHRRHVYYTYVVVPYPNFITSSSTAVIVPYKKFDHKLKSTADSYPSG